MSKRPRRSSSTSSADQPADDSRIVCTGPSCNGAVRNFEFQAALAYAKKSGNKEAPWYGVWALTLSMFLSRMYEKSETILLTPSFPQHPVIASLDIRDEFVQDRMDALKSQAMLSSPKLDRSPVQPQEEGDPQEEDLAEQEDALQEEDVPQEEYVLHEKDPLQEEGIVREGDILSEGGFHQEEDVPRDIFPSITQYALSDEDIPLPDDLDELDLIPRPTPSSRRSSRQSSRHSSRRSSHANTPIRSSSDDEFNRMPTDIELAEQDRRDAEARHVAELAAEREAELSAVVPLATLSSLDMSKRIPDFLQKICEVKLVPNDDDEEEDMLSLLRSRTVLIVENKPQVLCRMPFETTDDTKRWITDTASWKVSDVRAIQCKEQALHVFREDDTINTLGCIVAIGDLWNYSEFTREFTDAASEYVPSQEAVPAVVKTQSKVKEELDSIFALDNVVSIRSALGRKAFKLICERLKELNADYFEE